MTRLLTEQGHPVRALTRQPDQAALPESVEVVGGDLSDPGTLTSHLFAGVHQVFVFPVWSGVGPLVTAAAEAGVSRFVVLSSLAVAAERAHDAGSASYRHHQAVEKTVRESVAERAGSWTFLRPGTFATNLLSWAFPIRSGLPVRAPYLDSAQAPIHELDIAEAAVHVLTTESHHNQAVALTGPQALTRRQQIQAIAAGIGRAVAAEEISAAQFRAEFGRYIPDDIVTMLLDYWADSVQRPDVPRSVEAVTGRPGRPLEQWARDHQADFTG
ncbi:SDR family oxidoreductase [Kineosporia corallincola]|uniref:SDR family oxidoreductase n=1 Tax=Kineosporia corallincola TaxID=2835133 RepID=UPI0027DF1EA3|nr:NAD(P)H-binding protein [Kineosporia corallincola]